MFESPNDTRSTGVDAAVSILEAAFNGVGRPELIVTELLVTLVPFGLVSRYGVVAREEAYLERKFGDIYRRYRSRVRRWL
jgi:protein-S-isoprenylcysteine O-methyltransferase Ste14